MGYRLCPKLWQTYYPLWSSDSLIISDSNASCRLCILCSIAIWQRMGLRNLTSAVSQLLDGRLLLPVPLLLNAQRWPSLPIFCFSLKEPQWIVAGSTNTHCDCQVPIESMPSTGISPRLQIRAIQVCCSFLTQGVLFQSSGWPWATSQSCQLNASLHV